MKIAYCVICHRNTNILRTMINELAIENDIFIHVDKKSNINDFNEYKDKVYFIENRIDVKWGSFKQIEVMLILLKRVLLDKKHDYICFLSGDCLPLKSSKEIGEILEKNKGFEFIGIDKNVSEDILERRVKYKYSEIYYKKNKNIIEKIYIKIQCTLKLLKKNKYYYKLPPLYKGSNWFCISYSLADYINTYLQNNKWYKDAFRYSFCGDEIFFQTIVMNSKYKNYIYKYNEECNDTTMALRYIDWSEGLGSPKTLNEQDFTKIKQKKDCIFARKFSDNLNIDKYKEYFFNTKDVK